MTTPIKGATTSGDVALATWDQTELAALAYRLWQERGCPIDSPDEDWYRAERELSGPRETLAEAA